MTQKTTDGKLLKSDDALVITFVLWGDKYIQERLKELALETGHKSITTYLDSFLKNYFYL